jgi:aminoglycoside phosphotransferase family enzyme/predicted kinase
VHTVFSVTSDPRSEPSALPEALTRTLERRAGLGAVALHVTHASWVFVAGDDVWKVKRPVDFGFLDFRTTEARRRFCEAEISLNRRLAPDVYLGVEPVRATAGGLELGAGPGPVVDWAVHMRRLPDAASAESLLARGTLDAGLLERLAARLAAFLGAAPRADAHGAFAALEASVAENFAQVAPFVGDLCAADTFDETRAFQTAALGAGADRFAARVAEGRIRDGHGDLRLEHVYFLPGPGGGGVGAVPTVIDCIEFNDRFRCGDAAGEAAFLAMELEAARRPDLAAGFLARFAEASGDIDLYGVLDFYLSYRAWVRGKVACFVAADANAPAAVRSRKRDEARRHFALARSFAGAPVDRPFLLAVGGMIGSGKSTLAAALGRALAAPVVGSDRTRKELAGLAPTARGGPALYAPENVARAYEEVLRRAGVVLEARRGVILDATFSAPRWRQAAADLARRVGAGFIQVEARCADRAVLEARLAARRAGGSISDATDAELALLEARYIPPGPSDPGPRLAVDTAGPPDAALAQALAGLAAAGVLPASERRRS